MFKKIFERVIQRGFLATVFSLCPNRLALLLYRTSNLLYRYKIPELPHLLYFINSIIFGCEIHFKASIGKRFCICHSHGIVVGMNAVIGENVTLYSGVVVGNSHVGSGMPVIGNNVIIGSGTKVLGKIIVGNDVVIGANSVVISDVKDKDIVAGVPAKKINSKIGYFSKQS